MHFLRLTSTLHFLSLSAPMLDTLPILLGPAYYSLLVLPVHYGHPRVYGGK